MCRFSGVKAGKTYAFSIPDLPGDNFFLIYIGPYSNLCKVTLKYTGFIGK